MALINLILGLCNTVTAVLVATLAIPLLLARVPPNGWYGVRFPKSFESDEIWYEINRYGARLLLYASVVLFAVGVVAFFVPLSSLAVILAFALAPVPIYLVPCVLSYRRLRTL